LVFNSALIPVLYPHSNITGKAVFMQKLFKRILVTVDFSTRSRRAAVKALLLAEEFGSAVTFIHITDAIPLKTEPVTKGLFFQNDMAAGRLKEVEYRLGKIIRNAVAKAGTKTVVATVVLSGTWHDRLIDYVNNQLTDLVIISQKSSFAGKAAVSFNPDKIAAATNIPVITIPSNRQITGLRSILIPVTDFLPVRKIMYGIYMASVNNATLKLLGVENGKNAEKSEYYLYKTYKLIRDNCAVNIELGTIQGNNVAEAVNEYALRSTADLIIVNPGTQTRMAGFFSAFFTNILQKNAAFPVMTISPL
jgi:nucleotide-binding universal stress UspA family protein